MQSEQFDPRFKQRAAHMPAMPCVQQTTDIRRWIDAAIIPQDVTTWLEDLVAFHQAHPPPRKQRKAAARPRKLAPSLA